MMKFLLSIMIMIPVLLNGQISILSPFGGEYFQKNTTTQIRWETPFVGTVEISFSSDGGINWSNIESDVDANLGTFDWTLPDINSTSCKVRISPIPDDGSAITSYNFTIGDKATLPRILVNEEFEEWIIFSDIAQVTPGAEISNSLKVINDDDFLNIYFETDEFLSLQNDNSLTLYIDLDDDSSTGKSVNGIGAEIEFIFGDRRGTVYVNNSEYAIGVGALFLIISPTVWSDKFEITINLNSSVGGTNLFSSERIRLLIKDESTGVSIPGEDRGSGYRIADYNFDPLQGYSMVKQSDEFIRVMSHNVLFSNFMKPEATGAYQRLYRAVQPDIIGFSELYTDYSIDEIITRLEEILPSPEGKSWKVERTNDNVLATRYSIKFNTSAGPFGNGAFLVDLRPTYNSDLFVVVAHPPCCDNDPARQDEADAIAAFIRDAKAPGGELTLIDKTPVMIVGDMNFVGDPRQVSTLVDGDIVQENIYGNDYIPDWDGTSFEDSKPLSSNLPHTFTHNGGDGPGTYSNGRLDYIIYSGSVLDLENSFVMFTPAMPQDTLTLYGLIDSDTDIASDHLPLIADFKLTYEQNETVLYGIRQNDENGIPVMIDQIAAVDGIVTASDEFGIDGHAFIQDSQAGIAIFGSSFVNQLSNGDSITITGTVSDYSGLTRLKYDSGTSSLIVHKTVEVPNPRIVTIGDINGQEWNGRELLEGRLIQIEDVQILSSGIFTGDTNYEITDGIDTMSIRISSNIDLVNTDIPSEQVNITGCLSQYKSSIPYNDDYQLLPRSSLDLDIINEIEHVSILTLRQNDNQGVPIYSDSVKTSGVVTATTQFGGNGPAFIQDSEAGIAVYGSAFVSKMEMGDSVTVTGHLVNYKGLTEFTFDAEIFEVIVHKNSAIPAPQIVTISEILEQEWNGVELLEAKLVKIRNVEFLETGSFEAGNNYQITDGSGTMNLRVNSEGILDGVQIPAGKVTVIGIVGQYKSSAPYSSGYQFLPRSANDILINEDTGSIDIISPKDGDEFQSGSPMGIIWSSSDVEFVDIHYKFSIDSSWSIISQNISAIEFRYSWIAPQIASDSCRIKIVDSNDDSIYDISDLFSIYLETSVNNEEIPRQYYLAQNFPNPFNPTTKVSFGLPESGYISLNLFDNLGRRIKTLITENLNSGHYTFQLNAGELASGIYFYRLIAGNFIETKKMILLQ